MSLAPGARVGSYEIVALVGAGGMGEVYRARDGKLTRDVALKILPPLFARDPERLARFSREANLLATLNHPNIAAIYGFESSDHSPALVLEMVEGPTLAERIERGPIPLEDALPIARQIADALEAAHAQGIVHRDLKPANIKVRDDGTVKVLDFGLAKAIAVDSSPGVVPLSPTITSPAATAMGTIMGTAAYMSPEQARGRAVDKRSDIWAFGAVLYEMLTGRRAFDGEDVSYTLANILKGEPDWSALPAGTPPAIERVLRRCLTKDPRLRTHDVADVRIELDERASADAATVHVATGGRPGSLKGFERMAWLGVALALAAIAGFALWRGRAPEPVAQPVLRFQIPPPEKHSFGALGGAGVGLVTVSALSPDGTRLVFYAADQSGRAHCGSERSTRLRRGGCRRLMKAFSRSGHPIVDRLLSSPDEGCTGSTWRAASDAKSARSLEIRAEAPGARPGASSSRRVIHQRSCRLPRKVESRHQLRYGVQRTICRQFRGLRFFLTVAASCSRCARKLTPSAASIWRRSGHKTKAEGCYQATHRRSSSTRVSCCLVATRNSSGSGSMWRRSRCQGTPFPSSIACAVFRRSRPASSQLPIRASWRTGRGWMRRTSSRGWIVRASLEAPLDQRDDIGRQRCPRTVSDSCIPTLPTAI